MARVQLPKLPEPKRCKCCGTPLDDSGKAWTSWPFPQPMFGVGRLIGKSVDPILPPITNLEEPV